VAEGRKGKGMQRFVLEQNIVHFEKLLGGATDESLRRTLQTLLLSAQRQLAVMNANTTGTAPLGARFAKTWPKRSEMINEVRPDFQESPHPYLVLDPGPGLNIVDINDAYARATFILRDDVVGKSLFDVFPDNPDDELADGVRNLYASLRAVAETGKPNSMRIQRYDVRDPTGRFVERYWQPLNTPIHDDDGRLMYILHHVEDVTAEVLGRPADGAAQPPPSRASDTSVDK
jgi:PAS domain-containing protein